MWLHRVTPDPFENSKSELSGIGQAVDRWTTRRDSLIGKVDRFGNGARRSDFEIEIKWEDVEDIIARFANADHARAKELQSATALAKAAEALGWQQPKFSDKA